MYMVHPVHRRESPTRPTAARLREPIVEAARLWQEVTSAHVLVAGVARPVRYHTHQVRLCGDVYGTFTPYWGDG